MLKSLTAIMAAAAAAATVTLLSAPTAQVTAGPMPAAASAPMQACAQRAWPYNNCVGTPYGKPNVRLVTTDRLN
jgi:hypothetical protein